MEVYISINGVLRNLIQKFEYHYQNNLIDSEIVVEEGETPFDYRIYRPIRNDKLENYFSFESKDEFNNFLYVDFPLEIFGHSQQSYPTAMSDLNKMIYDNPQNSFTLIGLDEYSKAKPSTLYFLSKYSFMGNKIKFIMSTDISKEWENCDLWLTDDDSIIKNCPNDKTVVKFKTEYNEQIIHKNEISKIEELCLKSWENTTTSTLTKLLKDVVQFTSIRKKLRNIMGKKTKGMMIQTTSTD